MFIDIEDFKMFFEGQIFASGVLPNSPEGLFMTRDGGELRWVAKKGWGNDWAVYCHWSYHSEQYVAEHGDKVLTPEYIQRCVPCSDEVMSRYRV
jgi:hypothetical protein